MTHNKKIFNGTPHVIVILEPECAEFVPDIRKNVLVGEKQVITTLSAGTSLSARYKKTTLEPVNGIQVVINPCTGCDELPDGYDYYLVSQQYASARRELGLDTSKLLTVGDPVYSTGDQPKPIGCLGFQMVATV